MVKVAWCPYKPQHPRNKRVSRVRRRRCEVYPKVVSRVNIGENVESSTHVARRRFAIVRREEGVHRRQVRPSRCGQPSYAAN
jgi:hypothetical protein